MTTSYYFSNSQRNSRAAAATANPRVPARQNPATSPGHTTSHHQHQIAQEAWQSMVESDPMARELESLSVASRSSPSTSSPSSPSSSPRR